MLELSQIFGSVNLGLVVLDRDLSIRYWNAWMARHSGIPVTQAEGANLFDLYPGLDTPKFHRNRRAVLTFGTYAYFSQKLHRYLFPFPLSGALGTWFSHMQQSCTLGPIRDEAGGISGFYILVQDVTELALTEQKLVQLGTQDPLTGVFNRRHFESRLNEELQRALRYEKPLSLILLDVDHFKQVNDRFGHDAGDRVLIALAARLGSRLRASDCFARIGGEEFCCLLPETTSEAACLLAERFRESFAAEPVDLLADSLPVTISLGVSTAAPGDGCRELLGRADKAMYEAKRSGRNCVRRG